MFTETEPEIPHLTAQRQATRAAAEGHSLLLVSGQDPVRGNSDKASFVAWQASGQDAILQPPKPEIVPSITIPQVAAEHDTEPDHEAAD
jgi:hypothetical protein